MLSAKARHETELCSIKISIINLYVNEITQRYSLTLFTNHHQSSKKDGYEDPLTIIPHFSCLAYAGKNN